MARRVRKDSCPSQGGHWLTVMQAILKQVVFTDEGFRINASLLSRILRWPFRWILPPPPYVRCEFPNYLLAYRLETTSRELKLIKTNNMFCHPVLTLREEDGPLTFADLLGPEFVPEVSPHIDDLLMIQARVYEAAICWSRVLQSMPDPK